jgi:hypothetical protein
MAVIALTTKEWEHETRIVYPFDNAYEAGAPASYAASYFKEYRCGSCGTSFSNLILGWFSVLSGRGERTQPTGLEFRFEEGE